MVFDRLDILKKRLLENEALSEGFMFYEVEDQYLRIDDSRIGYFYLREYSDRFGDSMSVERMKITGCGYGYKAVGNYFLVACIDKCLDLTKVIPILMYQVSETDGVIVRGLGSDERAVYAQENGEELLSSLPFHVVKLTIQLTYMIEDLANCEGLSLCNADCCI